MKRSNWRHLFNRCTAMPEEKPEQDADTERLRGVTAELERATAEAEQERARQEARRIAAELERAAAEARQREAEQTAQAARLAAEVAEAARLAAEEQARMAREEQARNAAARLAAELEPTSRTANTRQLEREAQRIQADGKVVVFTGGPNWGFTSNAAHGEKLPWTVDDVYVGQAKAAGVQVGDRLTHINGELLTDKNKARAMSNYHNAQSHTSLTFNKFD